MKKRTIYIQTLLAVSLLYSAHAADLGLPASAAPASTTASKPADKPSSAVSQYTGFLVDRSCAAQIKVDSKGSDPSPSLKKHTRHCSLEPSCCEAGYSLYSQGKWFDLDAKGNELAKKIFEQSKKESGHMFNISGVFKRNELRVASIVEAK